jgi:hypothetical protein
MRETATMEEMIDTKTLEGTRILEYIDEAAFVFLIFLFMVWRISKSDNYRFSRIFKANIRCVGIIFLFLSGASSVVYYGVLIYLSNFFNIDKSHVERLGALMQHFFVEMFDRKIDLVSIMNISLSFSQIFRVSAIFLLIGLWLPCAYSFAIRKKENEDYFRRENDINLLIFSQNDALYTHKNLANAISHASIVAFATLYAFIRIPPTLLMDLNKFYTNERMAIFYRSAFYGSELYLCALFFVILKTRFLSNLQNTHQRQRCRDKGMVENLNLLIIILAIDAFVRYYFNIISIPIELNGLIIHILKKVAFITQLSLYILMTTMFCPLPAQIYENRGSVFANEKPFWKPSDGEMVRYGNDHVTLVSEASSPKLDALKTTVIEFGDDRHDMIGGK